MRYRILALIEDNIATTLLLATRLGALGHHVEVLSDVREFVARLAAERFDWLLLDGDVVHTAGRSLVDAVSRRRGDARVVWLGRRLSDDRISITAHFAKPISYAELSRYFSAREPPKGTETAGHTQGKIPDEWSFQ